MYKIWMRAYCDFCDGKFHLHIKILGTMRKGIFTHRLGLVPLEEKSIKHQAIVSLCLTE